MDVLQKFIATLTPPPFVSPADYDGLEFKWRFLSFKPALFKTEAYLLGLLAVYTVWALIGKSINHSRVSSFVSSISPLLEAQFAVPKQNGLTADGHTDFFTFSTGRKNVLSLHTTFTLRPRHDIGQLIYQLAWGLVIDVTYSPEDTVEFDFTLSGGGGGCDFVWAAVPKSQLRTAKTNRWDLDFTKTTESAALPPSMSVMSEFADVTEVLLGKTPLAAILSNKAIEPYLLGLSITDQPRVQPTTLTTDKEKHMIVTLRLPPAAALAELQPFFSGLFTVVDALPRVGALLRPETKAKLKKTREAVEKGLKDSEEKDRKEEAEEERRARKKREDEEKLSSMSAEKQQKHLEKERKREMKKAQMKGARK